ncbi:MAG: type II toxin-antitoxin system VapC family toxin [Gemmatimonadota bacterium]|nr:type II toxin-antitoxin system VapC family toxin [Gemmatimonadota bacterium]
MAASDLFLDASYVIALSATTDQHHRRAIVLSERLEASRIRLVTTRAVVLEIGNALSKLRYREAAVTLLNAIENDPMIEVVPLAEPLYARALEFYQQRADKEWGLTDCISFIVMRERGIGEALTADEHFRQAGFRVLLADD